MPDGKTLVTAVGIYSTLPGVEGDSRSSVGLEIISMPDLRTLGQTR
jgi:hypothetical protein